MPLEFQSSEDKTINCKCPSCGKIISIDKTQLTYLNTRKYDIKSGCKCDCGSYYTGTTEIDEPKEEVAVGGSNNLLTILKQNVIISTGIILVLLFVSYSVINNVIENNRLEASVSKKLANVDFVDSWKIKGVILTIHANEKYGELDLKNKFIQSSNIHFNFLQSLSSKYKADDLKASTVRINHNNEWDYADFISLKTSQGEKYTNEDLKATSPPSNSLSQYSSSTLGDSFKSFAWSLAKSAVKESLKAPSTAKFPSNHNGQDIKQTDANTFIVNSYVDAQNSYGAIIRSNFSVKIKKTTGIDSYRVEQCTIY